MKKITTFLVIIFSALLLVACGPVKPPTPDPDPNDGTDKPIVKPKTVYLQYADWNRTEVNYQLLDAFMEKYHILRLLGLNGSGAEFTGNLLQQLNRCSSRRFCY